MIPNTTQNGQGIFTPENVAKQSPLSANAVFLTAVRFHNRIATVNDQIGFIRQTLYMMETPFKPFGSANQRLHVGIGEVGNAQYSLFRKCCRLSRYQVICRKSSQPRSHSFNKIPTVHADLLWFTQSNVPPMMC